MLSTSVTQHITFFDPENQKFDRKYHFLERTMDETTEGDSLHMETHPKQPEVGKSAPEAPATGGMVEMDSNLTSNESEKKETAVTEAGKWISGNMQKN